MKTAKQIAILISVIFTLVTLVSCESVKGVIASIEEKTTANSDTPIDTSWKEELHSEKDSQAVSSGKPAEAVTDPVKDSFNIAVAQLSGDVSAAVWSPAVEKMQQDAGLDVVVLTGDSLTVKDTAALLGKPSYSLKDSVAVVFSGKVTEEKDSYIVLDNGVLVSGLYFRQYLDPSRSFEEQVFYAKWERIDAIFEQVPPLSAAGCSKIVLAASLNEPPAEGGNSIWVLDSTVTGLGYVDNWRLKNGEEKGNTHIEESLSARFDYIYSKGVTPKSVRLYSLPDAGAVKTNAVIASY